MKIKLLCFVITAFSVITYAKIPTTTRSHQIATNRASNGFIVNQNTDPSPIQRVRLRFSSDDGLIRPLLLGFTPDNAASDGFDYGYDAPNFDQFPNDMFWNINGENYVIQGVGAFDTSKRYPLNIFVANAGLIHIALSGLENFDSEIDVFVFDSLFNTYTQINTDDFEMVLDSDNYQNRFYIAFSSQSNTLSVTDAAKPALLVNYLNGTSEIYIKSADLVGIKNVSLMNIFGQTVLSWNKTEFNNTAGETRIALNHVFEGTYIIKVETHNATINKKALIKN